MMTKWDTIQADLEPVKPKYWNDEQDEVNDNPISNKPEYWSDKIFDMLSLDEVLDEQEQQIELEELENE